MDVKHFGSIVEIVEDHYQERDKGNGSGYKQFKQWEFMNRGRLNPDGTLTNVQGQLLDKYGKSIAKSRESYSRGPEDSWSMVSADMYEMALDGYNGGNGRVNCVAVDPSDPDIVFVGTPASGLWKSVTGGSDWTVPGSSPSWQPIMEGMPTMGVSAIFIDPDSPAEKRTIYVLTGDGDAGHTSCTGVLKSTDGGNNWASAGLSFSLGQNRRGRDLKKHPSQDVMIAATNVGLRRGVAGTWTSVEVGNFFDVEFKPNSSTVYASTDTTIHISQDYGLTWDTIALAQFTPEPLKSERIELAVGDAEDANVVYAFFGGGQAISAVYRSVDSGQNWTRMDPYDPITLTPDIYLTQSDIAGGHGSMQAWYDLAIAVNPADADEVHVGAVNSWRSMNGGLDWELSAHWEEPLVTAGRYNHADVHNLDFVGGYLYCSSDGGIFRTSDHDIPSVAGELNINWKNRSYGLQIGQVYRLGVANNPVDNGIVFGKQDGGYNTAQINGPTWDTWLHLYGSDGMEAEFDPSDNTQVIFSTQGGHLKRHDIDLQTIEEFRPDFPGLKGDWITPIAYCSKDGSLTAGYEDVYRMQSPASANIADWERLETGTFFPKFDDDGDPMALNHLEVAPYDSDVIFACHNLEDNESDLYRTFNGGLTWATDHFDSAINKIVFHPTDRQQMWIALDGNFGAPGKRLYHTQSSGQSWTDVSNVDELPKSPITALVYQNGTDDGLYIGTDVGVYYKNDDMEDWAHFSKDLPAVLVTDLEISHCTDKIYASTFGRGIWEAPLYENSFTADLNLSGLHLDSRMFTADEQIVSQAVSTFRTTVYQSGGAVTLSQGFRAEPASSNYFCAEVVEPCDVTLPLSSKIAQIFDTMTEQRAGKNESGSKSAREKQAALHQALSNGGLQLLGNASSDLCIAQIDLDAKSSIDLSLYNAQGHLVNELISNETRMAGTSEYDISLVKLASGVYFVMLQTDDSRSVKKLIKL